ncbi:MAG: hypothetical protein ACOX2F_06220 [bacterium]
MKSLMLLVALSILILSCSENNENNSTSCIDEWEQTEVLSDYKSIYDFEIVKSESTWEWEKDQFVDSIYLDGPRMDWPNDLYVAKSGDIYLSGAFTDNTEEKLFRGFLNIYKKSGKLIRYSFEKDCFADAFQMVFDEKTGDLHLAVAIESNEVEPESEYRRRKTLIATLGSDEKWRFISWDFNGYNVCTDMVKKKDRFYLNCWYSEKINSVQHGSIQIIEKDKAYRKNQITAYNRWSYSAYERDGHIYFLSVTPGPPGQPHSIYELNQETLCVSGSEYKKIQNIEPTGIKSYGDILITVGVEESVNQNASGEHRWNMFFGHLILEDSSGEATDLKFGSLEEPETGYTNPKPIIFLTDAFLKDGVVFASGQSRFDIEDRDRLWCEFPENEKTNYAWGSDPVLIAVNNEKEVFARQLLTKIEGETATHIYVDKENVYIAGTFEENYKERTIYVDADTNIFIHRVPKKWILNADAKAKEPVHWVTEIKTEE